MRLVIRKFLTLKTELVDQAWALERQRRLDAADVLIAASNRIGEICDELRAPLPAKRSLRAQIRRSNC